MSSTEGFESTFTQGTPTAPGTYPAAESQWAPKDNPSSGEPSTADVAKDQAASVAGGAKDAAKDVAGTAKEQAGQVATEAKKQVKDLVGQARSELSDQAAVQQQRVAGGLHSVGDQLRAMAQGSDEQGPVTDLAHQAADKAHEFADFFDNRDPGSVLNEVRAFARKQPGVFLALSLGAGVLAGRLARGLSADPDDSPGAAPAAASNSLSAGSATTPAALTAAPYTTPTAAGSAFDLGAGR